jgi:hypothetical protein
MRGGGFGSIVMFVALGLMAAACGAGNTSGSNPVSPNSTSTSSPSVPSTPSGPTDPNGVAISDWPDACKLLTGGDLTQTFSVAFQAAEPEQGTVGSTKLPLPIGCVYNSDNVNVTVSVEAINPTVAGAKRYFQAGKTIDVKNLTPVSGLGNEAYTSDPPLPRTVMREGRVVLRVEVDAVNRDDRGKAASTQLMRLAAPRLLAATPAARG